MLILYRAHGASALVALAAAVFVAPFLLFSGIAGELADRYDKARVASTVKAVEIGAAALAVVGFLLQSVPVLFAGLLAFGILAALFGPVKYGLLPDLLETARLPLANALVDAATFLAILLGTALGGLLGARDPDVLAAIVMLFALLALGSSLLIPRPGAARPDLKLRADPFAAGRDLLRALRHPARLWRAALVNAWFWLAGIVCLTLLPVVVRDVFHRGPGAVTLGLTAFSIGIGAGSLLAARRMRGTITLAPARAGSLALGVAALAVAATLHSGFYPAALAALFVLAAAGGLVAVPSFAAIQAWSNPEARARAVAGTNILSAAAMVGATIVLTVALHFGIGPGAIFVALAAAAFAIGIVIPR